MIQHPPTGNGPTYMTRKSQTGPVSEDGDPSARLEWKPATKSALKKATGLYEQHKRKQAKAAEHAVREKEEVLSDRRSWKKPRRSSSRRMPHYQSQ
jgi:asparaginyl-tRNA synthetase